MTAKRKPRISMLIQEFMLEKKAGGMAPRTQSEYGKVFDRFAEWSENRECVTINELDRHTMLEYFASLRDNPNWSEATVAYHIRPLRAWLNWLYKNEATPNNLAQVIKAPKTVIRKEDVPTLDEIDRTLCVPASTGVLDLRDRALILLMLDTGLRAAETADLKISDLQLTPRKPQIIVRSGKGGKYREIPLHPTARKTLEAYLAVRPQDKGEALFLGQRGALGKRGIQFRIEALAKATQIKVSCHVLRHTCGTRMLRESKADLVTVAEIMGHSSVNTTMIYTQPGSEDKRKAVEGVA